MSSGRHQVGQQAPAFTCTAVIDGQFKEISLPPYTEAKLWLVLVFFPRAWSFICPTEIRAFSSRLDEFLYSRSCGVVFASTDNEHCLRAWNSTSASEGGLGGVHIPLISDTSHTLSRDYGVLLEEEGVAQRALFIIDPKGKIRAITINDADVGRSVDETQRVLDALIFLDENGTGCPVDWRPGDSGIEIAPRRNAKSPLQVMTARRATLVDPQQDQQARPEIDVDHELLRRDKDADKHKDKDKDRRSTWSEWARPKLNRAWSSASQRSFSANGLASSPPSLSTGAAMLSPDECSRSHPNLSRQHSNPGSGALTPYSPPTPAVPVANHFPGLSNNDAVDGLAERIEESLATQAMENLSAARQNSTRIVGVAM